MKRFHTFNFNVSRDLFIELGPAMIQLLNYYLLGHTQPFSFLDKLTGPVLPVMARALCLRLP